MTNTLLQYQKKYPKIADAYAIAANIGLTIAQISIKCLHKGMSNFFAIVLRSIFLAFLSYIIITTNKDQINIKNPITFRLILKRALFNCLTLTSLFWAVNYAPIGLVNSLFYTSPILTPFVEMIFYGHPVHKTHLILTIFSFIGVLLIIKPPFMFSTSHYESNQWFVYAITLFGALTSSFSIMYLHDLKNSVNPNVALFHFYIGQMIFNSFFVLQNDFQINYTFITVTFVCMLFLFFFSSFFTQYFMLRSAFIKKASAVMPYGYVTVMTSFIGDIFIFGQTFDFISVLGMGMASVGLISKMIVKD